MGRRNYERRKVAGERWPLLSNLMACYFNEDFDLLYGSLSGATAAAGCDGTFEHRRAILKEWRDWNSSEGAVDDIRPLLRDSFGIAVSLKTSIDGRDMMNQLYDELIVRVKRETQRTSINTR